MLLSGKLVCKRASRKGVGTIVLELLSSTCSGGHSLFQGFSNLSKLVQSGVFRAVLELTGLHVFITPTNLFCESARPQKEHQRSSPFRPHLPGLHLSPPHWNRFIALLNLRVQEKIDLLEIEDGYYVTTKPTIAIT